MLFPKGNRSDFSRAEIEELHSGGVLLEGVYPCQRCAVPGRSPTTGEAIPGFAKTFAERRREGFPAWVTASRFDHFYRLAVNTRPAQREPGSIRVGDEVAILGVTPR